MELSSCCQYATSARTLILLREDPSELYILVPSAENKAMRRPIVRPFTSAQALPVRFNCALLGSLQAHANLSRC